MKTKLRKYLEKKIFGTSMSKGDTTARNSLYVLAFLAAALGILVVVIGTQVYDYSWFNSISASATTPPTTSMILPFVLGGFAVFGLGYRGYDIWDWLLMKIMAIGATGVAMQVCSSQWSDVLPAVGIAGLTPHTSNIVHSCFAIALFAALWILIQFRFTKGALSGQTPEKAKRNRIYKICGYIMVAGIAWFVLGDLVAPSWPNIWLAEELMLLPAAFALAVKAGIAFRDQQ